MTCGSPGAGWAEWKPGFLWEGCMFGEIRLFAEVEQESDMSLCQALEKEARYLTYLTFKIW